MTREKIVVTGLGALAPNGNGVDEFWLNTLKGISGIGPITYFDTKGHRVTIAGELNNFNTEKYFNSKELRKLDPFTIYAICASQEALQMANLIGYNNLDLDRVGVTIGTGVGGIQTLESQHTVLETKGARRVSPLFVPKNDFQYRRWSLSNSLGFSRSKSNGNLSMCFSDRCYRYSYEVDPSWRCRCNDHRRN